MKGSNVIMKEHHILINTTKCIGCNLCLEDCPSNNITHIEGKISIKSQNCIMCGHCVASCPYGAISITGFDEQPKEIIKPTCLEPEQLLEAVRTRRSIRKFKSKQVPPEVIFEIINVGRLTPSGSNKQNVSYIVLQDDIEQYERMAVKHFQRLLPLARIINPIARNIEIDPDYFFKKAPAVILIVSRNEVNGSLAAANMSLMAEAHGLGVLYSGFFSRTVKRSWKLRKSLNLSRKDQVVATLVLGYPDVKYYRTAQKDAARIRYL